MSAAAAKARASGRGSKDPTMRHGPTRGGATWTTPTASSSSTGIGRDSDFNKIVTMLRHIKDKAHKDGQKKIEHTISRSYPHT